MERSCTGLSIATLAALLLSPLGAAEPVGAGPTHQQVALIRPTDGNARQKLTSFCLTPDGRIVALLTSVAAAQPARTIQATKLDNLFDDAEAAEKPAAAVVKVFDAEGKPLESWPVDFAAQAINVGPDGNIQLGGDGVLARYNSQGKLLARAEAPHAVAARNDPKTFEEKARQMLEEQAETYLAEAKRLEEEQQQLTDKDPEALSQEDRNRLVELKQLIPAYQRAAESRQKRGITDAEVKVYAQSLAQRQRIISAIAASDNYLYITCAAAKGFGYAVWRTDLDFQNSKMIITGLSGCCGQMDVQCCGDDLFVAENARHRVVRYDANGNKLSAWGRRDREGRGENFGGCCNPMNTRLVGGNLYVSESDGQVKLFTPEGKFQGLAGKANVEPGCKSSIVDVSADGEKIYYFDVKKSAICLLQRSPVEEPAAK
jgi:hypothetical protein